MFKSHGQKVVPILIADKNLIDIVNESPKIFAVLRDLGIRLQDTPWSGQLGAIFSHKKALVCAPSMRMNRDYGWAELTEVCQKNNCLVFEYDSIVVAGHTGFRRIHDLAEIRETIAVFFEGKLYQEDVGPVLITIRPYWSGQKQPGTNVGAAIVRNMAQVFHLGQQDEPPFVHGRGPNTIFKEFDDGSSHCELLEQDLDVKRRPKRRSLPVVTIHDGGDHAS